MRILLVNAITPEYKAENKKAFTAVPNGILYIAAVLERRGHVVQVLDCFFDDRKPNEFADFDPQVIGFSVISGPYIKASMSLSQDFKAAFPNSKIVWGNVLPSALPEQTLLESYIDFAVIGPGECTMVELMDYLENKRPNLDNIKGLAFKRNGEIVVNERRPIDRYLDDLPDPAWHLIDIRQYTEVGLSTGRGCAFRCSYCYHSSLSKGMCGEFSAERVIGQIERVKLLYGAKFVSFFNEDNFTFNRERLRKICHLLIDRKIKIAWSCDARADLDDQDIALMVKSGCKVVRLGMETGSQRMLNFLHKGIKVEQMERTFWSLVKHKIRPLIYIMYGFPTEGIEDFNATHDLLHRLDDPPYMYSRFVPFPGSTLADYCSDKGLIQMPQRLEGWPEFLTKHGHGVNLSEVPNMMIERAAKEWRDNFAEQRLRFTIRHNPSYLSTIFTNPSKFLKETSNLLREYFQIRHQISSVSRLLRYKSSPVPNS